MTDDNDGQQATITDEELERFSQKLEEWGQQLPEDEQRLLKLMLSSAMASTEAAEVEGFTFDTSRFATPPTPRTFSSATLDALKPVVNGFNSHAAMPSTYADTW